MLADTSLSERLSIAASSAGFHAAFSRINFSNESMGETLAAKKFLKIRNDDHGKHSKNSDVSLRHPCGPTAKHALRIDPCQTTFVAQQFELFTARPPDCRTCISPKHCAAQAHRRAEMGDAGIVPKKRVAAGQFHCEFGQRPVHGDTEPFDGQ